MKSPAIKRLRERLAAGQPALGIWVSLESPSITEIAVGLGLDWIVIDAEHGHLDWKEITEHLRATVRSHTVALVRLAELNAALVKRALDCGADGVIIPWIETAEQLQQAVSYAQYPPRGMRGIGGERATAWGQCTLQHIQEANENMLVVPLIESVRGGQNIDELLRVEGVDVFLLGPSDYSSSTGYPGQWMGPGVEEQLLAIKDRIAAAGKHCGIMTGSENDLLARREQGFGLLGVGSDCSLLLRSLHAALAAVGHDRKLNTQLAADDAAK